MKKKCKLQIKFGKKWITQTGYKCLSNKELKKKTEEISPKKIRLITEFKR